MFSPNKLKIYSDSNLDLVKPRPELPPLEISKLLERLKATPYKKHQSDTFGFWFSELTFVEFSQESQTPHKTTQIGKTTIV